MMQSSAFAVERWSACSKQDADVCWPRRHRLRVNQQGQEQLTLILPLGRSRLRTFAALGTAMYMWDCRSASAAAVGRPRHMRPSCRVSQTGGKLRSVAHCARCTHEHASWQPVFWLSCHTSPVHCTFGVYVLFSTTLAILARLSGFKLNVDV